MTKLVSIIISNYNYEQYIAEAIESVLTQTYQDFELIIVDDGSEDNSKSIIQKYLMRYPKKIKAIFKGNGGQASAFNEGYKLAQGDIIAFLDADDYWYENKLQMIVKYHEEFSGIQHNLLINDQLKFTHLEDKVSKQKRLLEKFGFMGTIPTSGLSFVKESIKNIFPIPEVDYKICADLYIKIMYLNDRDIFSIDEPLGCYRAHDSNNWYNTQLNSVKYNENTLGALNNQRVLEGKFKIEKECESQTIALVFLDSFNLNKEDDYVILGNGSLGTEIYNLINREYNIVAFSNSFITEVEKHIGMDLVPLKYIQRTFPNAKLLIASFQIEEVLKTLKEEQFNLNEIYIPKL